MSRQETGTVCSSCGSEIGEGESRFQQEESVPVDFAAFLTEQNAQYCNGQVLRDQQYVRMRRRATESEDGNGAAVSSELPHWPVSPKVEVRRIFKGPLGIFQERQVGLFSKADIEDGELLGEYSGLVISDQERHERIETLGVAKQDDSMYCMLLPTPKACRTTTRLHVCGLEFRNELACINDYRVFQGDEMVECKGRRANANWTVVWHRGWPHIHVHAIEHIPSNTEVLFDYGAGFFDAIQLDVMRRNLRADAILQSTDDNDCVSCVLCVESVDPIEKASWSFVDLGKHEHPPEMTHEILSHTDSHAWPDQETIITCCRCGSTDPSVRLVKKRRASRKKTDGMDFGKKVRRLSRSEFVCILCVPLSATKRSRAPKMSNCVVGPSPDGLSRMQHPALCTKTTWLEDEPTSEPTGYPLKELSLTEIDEIRGREVDASVNDHTIDSPTRMNGSATFIRSEVADEQVTPEENHMLLDGDSKTSIPMAIDVDNITNTATELKASEVDDPVRITSNVNSTADTIPQMQWDHTKADIRRRVLWVSLEHNPDLDADRRILLLMLNDIERELDPSTLKKVTTITKPTLQSFVRKFQQLFDPFIRRLEKSFPGDNEGAYDKWRTSSKVDF